MVIICKSEPITGAVKVIPESTYWWKKKVNGCCYVAMQKTDSTEIAIHLHST